MLKFSEKHFISKNWIHNINFDIKHLNNKELHKVIALLKNFHDLFFKEGDIPSAANKICHEIVTTTEIPLYSKIYKYIYIYIKDR